MFALTGTAPKELQVSWSSTPGVGAPRLTAVANAASGEAGWISPWQLVVLRGAGWARAVRVLFDGVAAPIVEVKAQEVLAVVPYAMQGRDSVSVVLESQGKQSTALRAMMVDSDPALFTVGGGGSGQAVAENGDGSPNSRSNPVAPGDFLTLYGTGEGQPDGFVPDQEGRVPTEPWLLPVPKLPIRVLIGGEEADVVYAGGRPGGVFGKLLIVVHVPATLDAGRHDVSVRAGGYMSRRGVTVRVGSSH